MSLDLNEHKLAFLKGVGPKKAEAFSNTLGINTLEDLLYHFPLRYEDRSKIHSIYDLLNSDLNEAKQIKGTIISVKENGLGKKKRLNVRLKDDTGSIELVWFSGVSFIIKQLEIGKEYLVFGKPKRFGTQVNISHPEIKKLSPGFKLESQMDMSLTPVYHSGEKATKEGLHSKGIKRVVEAYFEQGGMPCYENLPQEFLNKYQLPGRTEALRMIHFPKSYTELDRAKDRFIFEELFYLQMILIKRKIATTKKIQSYKLDTVGDLFNTFYKKHLPFQLTNAQKRVVREVHDDIKTGLHMNRLVQGDVGSGKTIVAFMCMLMAIDSGFQASLMAPTEILAQQHYESLNGFAKALGIRIELLTGSTKTKERRVIHEGLEDGSVHILVGTHALIEDKVQYKNLGLAIVDEQHRFGVKQRAKMWMKNDRPPHILVMTATPIPRTLAMTVYGDLDISVIDELPPGRKPIKTVHRTDANRLQLFHFMEQQIAEGRQIYVVYPLIEESKKLDFKDLMDGYNALSKRFPRPQYQLSMLHGQMDPKNKAYEMERFEKGETHIMVATTVIEVGVNVPNASVMVIESAERFGLSQLHQLRGRVGRGAYQSYCILMTGIKLSQDTRKRMKVMCESNDGFVISEADLELRGPGDLMGTQQSGTLDFKIADLLRDGDTLKLARNEAIMLMEKDDELALESNKFIKFHLSKLLKKKPNWGKIS